MTQWKIASSYAIGQGHIKKDIPCQDRTFKLIQKHKSGSFYGLALADGAGSYKHSDIGAEMISKKILYFIKSNFSRIFKQNRPNIFLIRFIEKELKILAKSKQIGIKELSSTLLFIAIKNDKFIMGHIGDGVIGMLNQDDDLKIISYPENGEYANSTFFTTSTSHKHRLRMLKGTLKSSKGFIMMSDGAEESLFDKRTNTLINSNKNIINWLENNSEKSVEKALLENLEKVITQNTQDDCSIGIMRLS